MSALLRNSSASAPSLTWGCGVDKTNCKELPAPPRGYFSQQKEDLGLVGNVFCDTCMHQRTYLEIGALDGFKYSNTLYLEKFFNWGGLLIEGHPHNAQNLIANRGKSGRNVIFNEAICRTPGTVNFTNNPGSGTAGVMETMDAEYMKKWSKRFRHGFVTVPCRPLSDLVRLAGIQEIDFFSLDVEGAELLVLQTFDWSVPVKMFCIELDREPDYVAQVHALLDAHGYTETTEFASTGLGKPPNTVFIHKSLNRTLSSRMQHCQLPANQRPCGHAQEKRRLGT